MSSLKEGTKELLTSLYRDIKDDKVELPHIPAIVAKIDAALSSENSSFDDMAEIIQYEVALSARILQLANSPIFMSPQKITTIRQALMRLGTNTVRNLVLCMTVKDVLTVNNAILKRIVDQYWAHSLQVGALSVLLAKRTSIVPSEEAMMAGIVHDIGILPMLMYLDSHEQVMKELEGNGEQWVLRLAIHFHADIGRRLLTSWNFPQDYVDVAALHHDQSESGSVILDVVRFAEMFEASRSDWGENTDLDQYDTLAKKFNINTGDLEKITALLSKELDEIKALFET